jgi:hypothetical protein
MNVALCSKDAHGARSIAYVLLIRISLVVFMPANVLAQDTLSISLNRSFGMAFGSYISGSFVLQGSGPDSIQNLTVYFNGDEVYFATGNNISRQFNTTDYPGGSTNITLMGIDDLEGVYYTSVLVVFIAEGISTVITGAIIVLVAVLVAAKYLPRLIRTRSK